MIKRNSEVNGRTLWGKKYLKMLYSLTFITKKMNQENSKIVSEYIRSIIELVKDEDTKKVSK